MAYARVLSVGLVGLDGHLVEVEADLAPGIPTFVLSGLPDTAVCQARDRVRAAVLNSGETWPSRRITVNLLPAFVPKRGTGLDLGVATAVLVAAGAIAVATVARVAFIGELGLDGSVRPVNGVLPSVLAAWRAGVRRVVVPAANVREAQLVPGVEAAGVDSLRQLLNFLRGEAVLPDPPPPREQPPESGPDLADVAGQLLGRRALEVAAAGGHNIAFFGPPGGGKTMLAERLPSILPPLDDEEALEVTAVHSVAGVLPDGASLIRRSPFQAPHHTATVAALVGGGSGLARPGMVTLAHRGVLFLD
ncbi:MAG: ATP-binding protein, partial [Micromonosporaceae bacterium]|nr:ATP-binding protein [Micromonosporaceae bacterium]